MTTAPMLPDDADADADAAVPWGGAVTRLAAYVVDLVTVAITLAGGSAAFAFLVAVITGHRLGLDGDRDLAGVALGTWWLAYFAGSWAIAGRTPGMALIGLRVVRPDGSPVPPAAAVVRAVTFPLSVALLGLGFAGIVVHPQRRALHDLLAGTAVVYDVDVVSRRTPPARRRASGPPQPGRDVERVVGAT